MFANKKTQGYFKVVGQSSPGSDQQNDFYSSESHSSTSYKWVEFGGF